MAESFGDQFTFVDVVTDQSKAYTWIAAAKAGQAVTLVLNVLPEGSTAKLTGARLTAEQGAILKLKPGEVRQLTV